MTRTWFITGASAGFGRLLTEKLLARGDKVAATLRKDGALDDLKRDHGDRLLVVSLDLTDTDAIYRAVKAAHDTMGRIDVVVSNAGYGLFGAAEELDSAAIRKQIDTNLIGSIELIRAVLPLLRSQGGGRILQVSSEGGQIAYPGFSAYHATKWGIEGFVEAVRQEVASFGIELTLVEPGPTRTNFGAGLVLAEPTETYEQTPTGELRRAFMAGEFSIKGDPDKMTDAMIDVVDVSPAPRRLTLGAGAYSSISKALEERQAELEAQKDIAIASDS